MMPSAQQISPEAVRTDETIPEAQKQEEAIRLLPESDTRTPVLGSVNINMLIRKNPEADFYRWPDNYKSETTQEEIKGALLLAGCVDGDVNRFTDNLRKPKTDNPEDPSNVAYDELLALIAKVRQRKEAYEKASEEAEGFKADVIFDSVKNFFHEQVIEGFKTKPIMTLAKIGVSVFLISKLWGMISKDNRKYVYGAGAVVGAAWLLNGIIPPMIGKQGFDLSELLGLDPSVRSRELDWFCKEAGINESRQRVGVMMRLTDVKVENLVSLYIAGGTDVSGKGEIDIAELLDDPNVSDEERVELEKLNTSTMRASLYDTVGKLIQLSGAKTPSEFAKMYSGQTLLSAIMQLYNGRPAGEVLSAMENSIDTSKSETDKKLETILSRMGTIENTEMYASKDKFWINDFPFDYEIQDSGLFISFGDVAELILVDDPVAFREAIVIFKDSTFELTTKAKDYIGKELTGYSGYSIDWEDNTWKVKGLRVEANAALGLNTSQTVEIEAVFTPDAYVEFKADGVSGTVKGADMKETLMKAALSKNIKSNGPSFCKGPEFKITSYDEGSGDININAMGTSVTLKYKDGKYSFLSANFGEGRLLEYYRDNMASKSRSALDKGLAGLKYNGDKLLAGYNLIANPLGTDADEYTEFRNVEESKSREMGDIFAATVRNLDQDGTDLDRRITEAEDKLFADLNATLQEIAKDFDSFKSSPDSKRIPESQFEADYIMRLQLAGSPSSYYKGETRRLVDILRSHDYAGIDKADLFVVGGTYYKVREKALSIFFKETGAVALQDSPSQADKELVSKTIQRISDALDASESHGSWADDTVWLSEFDKLFSQTVSKTTEPTPPPETPEPTPEVKIELNEANLDTKEKAFDEYKRYVGLYFDSLQGLVKNSSFDYGDPSVIQTVLRSLGAGTSEMPSKDSVELQWKVLIDFKKDEFLKNFETRRGGFYKEYEAMTATGADKVAAARGLIEKEVTVSGLPQKVTEIKNKAPQGAVYEDKYFEMLEALMFMDKPMFEGLPSNLQNEEVYRDYVRGVFAQMLRTGAKSDAEARNIYMSALQNMDRYSGIAWQKNDAYLYTKVAEADKALGASHPRNISAGYNVEEFMDLRYRRLVTSVSGSSGLDAYQKSEAIAETMATEKRFLDEKAIFWKDIDTLKLDQSKREEIGKKEASVHETVFELSVSENIAVILYKSTLNYMHDRLKEDVGFDGDDLKDHVVDTAKSRGIILDKNALNVVG